jgi:hypothetical protein
MRGCVKMPAVANVTVIGEAVRSVPGVVTGDGRVTVAAEHLVDAIGWQLKPEGLCRDDMCVPVRDRDALSAGDGIDLAAVATALGRQVVVDEESAIVAVALDAEARRRALTALDAPSFTLDDLAGSPHRLEEWRGRKKLLVAFASW